ncbi:unnamed protein product [Lupinus luteus]|uniref:Calmodulin-binding protein n=1 Tax=Lupinus luteus TaxID=3873 RepID=A0AAV1WQY8_LUPLU
MASKRGSESVEEVNDVMDRQVPSKRRHGHLEQETREEQRMNGIASLIRTVIREEIPRILQQHLPPSYGLSLNHKIDTSRGRAFQLCFINQLPKKIFTLSKIIAEDGTPLQIELRDTTYHNHIVNEEGALLKIQVCVINGDFGSNGSEKMMTKEEFNAKTLSPREWKGPLLKGDTFVTLKNGVGYINKKIVFSDNSSWTRSGMFRLGVKAVQSSFIGVEIREGISEPFRVKDNRGEVYKKHDCPSLNDEVWRLKRIAKDSKIHMKLSSHNINTVKDLLQLFITNQTSLKEIIGNISRKSWDTIIEHAKACDIDDDKLYVYHWFSAEESVSIVFNCIYNVVEVSFNRQSFRSLETLSLDEKRLVERVKQQAYTNVKDNLKVLETPRHGLVKTLGGAEPVQHGSLDQALQHFDTSIAQQGMWQNLCEASTSISHIDEATDSDQQGNFSIGAYNDENEWPLTESQSQIDHFPICFSPWEQQLNFLYPPFGDGSESINNHCSFSNTAVYISSKGKGKGKGKTIWHKIRSALKWVILHLSKKRKAKLFHS